MTGGGGSRMHSDRNTGMTDLDQERTAAVRRNRLKTYPGRLLFMVANEHETEHVPRAEIRAIAARRWSDLPAAELDEIVDRAIAERDREPKAGTRIDPETVNLRHPSEREGRTMADKDQVQEAVRLEIEADPEVDYGTLNARVAERLGMPVRRAQTSAFARQVKDELEGGPSTNGARPPAPNPSAAEAEPTPATDATEGIVEERPEDSEPGEQLQPSDLPPALEAGFTAEEFAVPEISIERSRRTPGRMDVRLSLVDVPPAIALRIGAALANAAEFELREGAAA